MTPKTEVGAGGEVALPSFADLKAFLCEYYLHSRFGDRDGAVWGRDYSDLVTRGAMEDLERYGVSRISPYESNRGRWIEFDHTLTVLNPDEAPAQIQRQAPHLTHITGAAS